MYMAITGLPVKHNYQGFMDVIEAPSPTPPFLSKMHLTPFPPPPSLFLRIELPVMGRPGE